MGYWQVCTPKNIHFPYGMGCSVAVCYGKWMNMAHLQMIYRYLEMTYLIKGTIVIIADLRVWRS